MPKETRKPKIGSVSREIVDCCYSGRVRYMNRAITNIYNSSLREHGITAAQLTLLSFVDQLAPVGPGELSKTLNMEKSTVSRNLSRMTENGWVAIEFPDDDRSQRVMMTRAGNRKLAKAYPSWKDAQVVVRALISDEGAASLLDVFRALRSGDETLRNA